MFETMIHRFANAARQPLLLALAATLVLAGCASAPPEPSSRYSIKQDRAPSGNFDASDLADATPRYEPPRKAGNKSPYTVWGRSYQVMASADGYVERGIASWYGEKFHGHKTSNGEIFDMYAMTAAHKSLPLPSYARVTNLDNGRSVIVRVNDRGPFHGDRLIDLSYAAAKKLGYQSRGTARVEVAAITVRQDGSMSLAGRPFGEGDGRPAPVALPEPDGGEALFVQLGSFSMQDSAAGLSDRARDHASRQVRIRRVDTAGGAFHRVQVGPFQSPDEARTEQQMLEARGFRQATVLTDRL
ncbi:MAG: septal ring lytic transglycosylase RlpA family protein [Marinobacter sp.]|uniref:septal ring lytic transglycosylase RlpA family protein n=1 Tax=Marinobacter sp. TaxID=50741 RepID=UPI00299E7286|nr:septal ring lytic transglycosylase RlpA family protein [Marinobacter sp.]MDX1634764.1 septal ring lytic transglycosylase RlpA family protein [Marinobacter sp.]